MQYKKKKEGDDGPAPTDWVARGRSGCVGRARVLIIIQYPGYGCKRPESRRVLHCSVFGSFLAENLEMPFTVPRFHRCLLSISPDLF